MNNIPISEWCQNFARQQIQPGDICVDATMGNGNDTLLLSLLTGENGKVVAFDIQPQALENTSALLREKSPYQNYSLHLCSHDRMNEFLEPDSVSCIMFNFGYLPGGEHQIATNSTSSLAALEQSLLLLKRGGILNLCIYSGGDSGFEERSSILDWLQNLNPRKYLVILIPYYNRPNNPPLPALVIKLK